MRDASPFFTVRVRAKRASHAEYYLKTQREVDALMQGLITARDVRLTAP